MDNEKLATFVEEVEAANPINETEMNKPSEEEIKMFEAEFEAAVESYNNMPEYVLGTDEDALIIAKTAIFYNNNLYTWKQDEWKGVCLFAETVEPKVKAIMDGETNEFSVDKNTLQWLYYIITNVSGSGYTSAKLFSDSLEDLTKLFEAVQTKVDEFKVVMDELKYLQDRVAAAYQGFYLRKDGLVDAGEDTEGGDE